MLVQNVHAEDVGVLDHFPALATTTIGNVVHVADGDTIIMLTPQKQHVKIRLYGIGTIALFTTN